MKNIYLIFLIIFNSCQAFTGKPIDEIEEVNESIIGNSLDTVLENNSSELLDMDIHQLFIDTSRQSDYYNTILNGKPSKAISQSLQEAMFNIGLADQIKIDISAYPNSFVAIRKLKNEFILYDRCNGNDPVYQITDSSFAMYGPLESEMEPIIEMIEFNGNRLKLRLRTYKEKSSDSSATLTINKSKYENIYRLTYECEMVGWEQLVIPISKVKDYNLVVNHCPIQMAVEYNGFDKE